MHGWLLGETLLEWVQAGIITPETAFSAAKNKGEFQERLGGMDFSQGGEGVLLLDKPSLEGFRKVLR